MATKAVTRSMMTPSLLDDFFKPWSEFFDNGDLAARTLTMPPVNVTEDPRNYMVSLAAPGLKKTDFHISIEGNMLTITSEKEEKTEEKDEKYTRKEYSYSSFSRSFTLPEDVKQDGIEAQYEDGVLHIRLPRKEEEGKTTVSKKITVK